MKKIFYLTIIAFLASIGANAQQGFGTSNPDKSAVIEMKSSNKGVLFPRVALTDLNDVSTIPSPATALTVFNTATTTNGSDDVVPGYYYWNGVKWTKLFEMQDQNLKRIGNNHITEDAGINGEGKSVGNGQDNIGIGYLTLSNNTSGVSNIAIGSNALRDNTLGTQNIGLGQEALKQNTAGQANTALGAYALRNNTTGNSNVAVGQLTMGQSASGLENTAIGNKSGMLFSTGSKNTFLGYLGGFQLANGSNNVFVGNSSGNYVTGGDNNVFIGSNSGYTTTTTVSNQLFIGNAAGDNALIRGDFSTKVLTINNRLKVADLAGTGTRQVSADANGQLITTPNLTVATKVINTNYTVQDGDQYIFTSTANLDVTLPPASASKGRQLFIGGASGRILSAPGTSEICDSVYGSGAASVNFSGGLGSRTFICDGVFWIRVV